jgi:hypothetical protein
MHFSIKTLNLTLGSLEHVHHMIQIGILRQDEKLRVRWHFSGQATSPKCQAEIGRIFALLLHADDRQTPLVNGSRQ